MPEGDTLYRTADVLRRALHGNEVTAAYARAGGVQLARVQGSRVAAVEARGKHLLIAFEPAGLTLHTHLGMKGSWHRYRPGDRWRRRREDAVAVIETQRSVAVCFDAPTLELMETRALELHPGLGRLGPDLLADPPDIDLAIRRLLTPPRAGVPVGEAILDQSAVAGIGNVYRSELLAMEGIDPFLPVAGVPVEALERLLRRAARLLRANADGGVRATVPGAPRGERFAYRRAGMPCPRCGTTIRSTSTGEPPRRLYWCPACQAPGATGRQRQRRRRE